MVRRSRKKHKIQTEQEMVIVVFPEDMDQAKDYQVLLRNNDIPAIIREQNPSSDDSNGIAVLVPEDFLDEAHIVVESQDAYDDFYDMSFEEDNDDDDFDIFDENF